MANIHIAESTLSSIAEAIREKWWLAGSMHASEMVGWLTSIKSTGDYQNIKNSSYLTFPELKSINTMSMFGENLISISLPNCSYIGNSAFANCFSLSSISIPNCSYIDSWAFYSCSRLTNSCVQEILDNYKSYSTVINSGVFQFCSGITSLDLTGYTSIGASAFYYCTNLLSISLPNCSYIGSGAFEFCSKLSSISIPNCSYIDSWAFYSCSRLTNSCVQDILNTYKSYSTVINYGVFEYCKGITSLDLTGYTSIGVYAFYYCTNLYFINLPNCSYIGNYAFQYCSSLTSISLPNCSYIGSYAFASCTKLESIYILSTSIPTLSNSNAFYSTPLFKSTYLGHFGSIYVLSSLVDSFKTATNWSYYSSRIVAYTGT